METGIKPALATDLNRKIRSLSLNQKTLRHLLELLQERSFAAGEIEVANFQQLQQNLEVYESNKVQLKEGFRFYITLKGTDGKSLSGSIEAIFDSPNFPESVESVFLDSGMPLKNFHNYTPRNSLVLFLDFTRPDVFNFTLLPSQETPNNSNIVVRGHDSTWVHGVFHEFDNFVTTHPSTVRWLHKHSIYDIFVWLMGLPLGFWACFRSSLFLEKNIQSPFLKDAVFIYLFFAVLFSFRILFHYARWVWPLVEYCGEKNQALKHRLVLTTIVLGVLCSAIYDLFKVLF